MAKTATRRKSSTKSAAKAKPRPKPAAKRPSRGPGFTQLRSSARALLPLVEADADAAERQNHLTDKVANSFRKAGLYAMLVPKKLGGSELPWVEAMQIVEEVSYADGSTGWCHMVQGVMGSNAGAFLPDAGAKKVYNHGGDTTVAGQGVPIGYAWPVKGGYKIKGKWGYGSSIWHADWVHSGCFVMDGDQMKMVNGHPEIVLCHHPKRTINLKGNWNVHGLRGTGSFDYTVKGGELFVPDETCYPFDNPPLMRGGVMYADGLPVSTSWGHTSWALGVGRRALDELSKLAVTRHDAYGAMCDSPSFQQSYAECEAKYRAARALVYAGWTELCENYAKGRPGTLQQIAVIRLAFRHIHDVISEISTFAHKASRGVSLRKSILQRAYRDIHAGTQHILLSDQIYQASGKVLMGAAGKKAKWNVLGLDE